MNVETTIAKIKSKGYWRVVIRPTRFERRRMGTLSKVREIVQDSKVAFRGWDYPHWQNDSVQNMGEWVECLTDWSHYIEFWRFYRSAQFIHLFALREDHIDVNQILPTRFPPRPSRSGYLGFVGAVYTVTEIFEFAARLGAKGLLDPTVHVSIGLHNVADHQLASLDASRFLRDDYVRVSGSPIVVETQLPIQNLIANTDGAALDTAVEIFENFNWTNPPRDILAEDQRRFRERRL